MFEVNHGVPVAGMMSSWMAWPDCSGSLLLGIDRRVQPLVEMEKVTRIEADVEERIAEVPLDERIDGAAGNADADRLVPIRRAGEIGRGQALDIVADRRLAGRRRRRLRIRRGR